jgi:ATP-dependent Clp protease ATP-binding subunit ClpA
MFERFTDPAREVVVEAQAQARRLGHNYIGCEHLLLAVAASDTAAGDVLRGLSATPDAIESAALRLLGGPSVAIDSEALAVFGIDLGAVRDRVETVFGLDALNRAPRRRHRWRGRHCDTGPSTGHIPFSIRAKKCLQLAGEASDWGDRQIGAEHIALALTSMIDGLAPRILTQLGIAATQAHTAILDRYRRAG